jgi:hypothetical protein
MKEQDVRLWLIPTGSGGSREQRFTFEEIKKEENREKFIDLLNSTMKLGECCYNAIKHNRAQVAVNICGYDGKKYYHGGNGSIIDAKGNLVGYTPFFAILEQQKMAYAVATLEF